ncbi:MAG TPA: ABC transporter ATP-binding protein [Acetobacteraceae bacterium]|nr:ABC transporter ATP-binding protein [Acetobacteraceae bacterium]
MRLDARGVALALGGRPVLRDVDAAVRPGELLGLIGANGAGKSTLLRVLAGLRRPDRGSVALDGVALEAIKPTRLALARAYLPQESTAHWSLTAEEVVGLGRLPHRANPGDDPAAVERALRRTGTLELRGRRIDEVSGGERMRVLLARALAVEAPILLADEPIAGLDPLQQIRIMQVLRDLAAEGVAVVAVLHDLTLAARFCARLLLLHAGAVLADGAPDAVLTDGHLATAYGVSVRRLEGAIVPWEAASDSLV